MTATARIVWTIILAGLAGAIIGISAAQLVLTGKPLSSFWFMELLVVFGATLAWRHIRALRRNPPAPRNR